MWDEACRQLNTNYIHSQPKADNITKYTLSLLLALFLSICCSSYQMNFESLVDYFLHFSIPNGGYLTEKSRRFPRGKPAARESRCPAWYHFHDINIILIIRRLAEHSLPSTSSLGVCWKLFGRPYVHPNVDVHQPLSSSGRKLNNVRVRRQIIIILFFFKSRERCGREAHDSSTSFPCCLV